MFIKRATRYNKGGDKVVYYQLAHNTWDSQKQVSRTKVLASLGRSDNLDREAIRRLITSLQRLLAETAPAAPVSADKPYGRHARREDTPPPPPAPPAEPIQTSLF